MVSEKYEVGYAGDCSYGHHLSESLGKQFPVQGFVGAGCPLGSHAFVQSEANSAADKTVHLIKCVLELPFSAQDKQMLLRGSLQSMILHLVIFGVAVCRMCWVPLAT